MATATVDTTNPQTPGPWDKQHPGKKVFIPDSSGAKKEMALLTYNILPEKLDEFKTSFFNNNVVPFYKAKGATDVHSWMVNNRLFVLGTPEVNVPWLGPTGIKGLQDFVSTSPETIEELPLFSGGK